MIVKGTVRGLGTYYADGVERLEIYVKKAESQGLPTEEERRVPITLVVAGQNYEAGLRSTANNDFVWISPDLTDSSGRETKLAYVLPEAGFVKNKQVELEVSGRVVTLSTAGG